MRYDGRYGRVPARYGVFHCAYDCITSWRLRISSGVACYDFSDSGVSLRGDDLYVLSGVLDFDLPCACGMLYHCAQYEGQGMEGNETECISNS